jgi:hypothetical protein
MDLREFLGLIITLVSVLPVRAQVSPATDGRSFERSGFGRAGVQPPGSIQPAAPSLNPDPNAQRQIFDQAGEINKRIQQSGAWEKGAADFERTIDSVWAQGKMATDADQFVKRLVVGMMKPPPWDMDARMKVFDDLVQERYCLDETQARKLRGRFIQNSFVFFLQNGQKLLPVVRKI